VARVVAGVEPDGLSTADAIGAILAMVTGYPVQADHPALLVIGVIPTARRGSMGFVVWLQIGLAICAFAAAFFWFRSATSDAPPMTYEGIESLKPWLDQAAGNNRWAASFAGVSAVLAGIATLATPG
jgi:hypothetical protein